MARSKMIDNHIDSRREMHRQQTDASKSYHDVYRRIYNPRSAAFHDQAEARHFAYKMNKLGREEYLAVIRINLLFGTVPVIEVAH